MNALNRLFLSSTALLVLAAIPGRALTYEFSYVFGDGLMVTGAFDGTPSGNRVEDISDVSLFFNGAAVPGNVFVSRFDGADYVVGASVSSDASLNDFVFADSDLAGGDFGALTGSFFYFSSLWTGLGSIAGAQSFPLGEEATFDQPLDAGRWSLRPTAVPEVSTTAVLLALAALGFAGLRRFFFGTESAC
jgi:hypothetical protein